mgnify:FL=1
MLPKAYKKKTSMAIKLKTDDSYVVNADYFETVGQQDVLLLSQHGVGLRFAVKSIPEIGARTAGVKAMDLRNEDTIKAAVFVTNEAQRVAIMADNGAFKYMPVSEITRSKRANKGLLIFTQKKTVAYHVATATILNIEDTALEILTTRWQKQELQLSDYKPSQRVGNGQYVVDVKKYGEPWRVQPLTIAKTK